MSHFPLVLELAGTDCHSLMIVAVGVVTLEEAVIASLVREKHVEELGGGEGVSGPAEEQKYFSAS
jgi:hypothetical protein